MNDEEYQGLMIPVHALPPEGQVITLPGSDGEMYSVLRKEDAQGLFEDRRFLHVLRRVGLASWSLYKKSIKEYRKEVYGESN